MKNDGTIYVIIWDGFDYCNRIFEFYNLKDIKDLEKKVEERLNGLSKNNYYIKQIIKGKTLYNNGYEGADLSGVQLD